MMVFRKTVDVFVLIGHYLKMLFQSNFRVAADVLTPAFRMNPAIIGIDLNIESDFGIFLLTNLITMTPGTLSLDLSGDKKRLYVHVMYAEEVDKAEEEIRLLENKIKKITGR